MPARTRRPFHNQKTRDAIKASQLVNRLQNHIDGDVELSASQITAATVLLKKCLPDLQAVEVQGDVDAHVEGITVKFVGGGDEDA